MAQMSRSEINVVALLAKLAGLKPPPERNTFVFDFDGSETTKELPQGWKPFAVYLDGSRQFEGSGDDYTLKDDGFRYSIIWAVAPANTSSCHIDAERQNV